MNSLFYFLYKNLKNKFKYVKKYIYKFKKIGGD